MVKHQTFSTILSHLIKSVCRVNLQAYIGQLTPLIDQR